MKKIFTTDGINEDLGKFLLRFVTGGLMLFFGFYKLIHGQPHIPAILRDNGMPEFLQYGVPIGETLCPILIILGIYSRSSALVVAFTMISALYLYHGLHLFDIVNNHGLPRAFEALFFLVSSISIYFLGEGAYTLPNLLRKIK